jgi:cell division septum initiation protein DivIVA
MDENRLMDIIDQMRVSIPDEIKKAQQINVQRDRILAQAQEEANRTLALAREKSEKMVERNELTQASQARRDQIIEQARREALLTQKEADRYVVETLTNLESELTRALTQVQNGIKTLEANKPSIPQSEA